MHRPQKYHISDPVLPYVYPDKEAEEYFDYLEARLKKKYREIGQLQLELQGWESDNVRIWADRAKKAEGRVGEFEKVLRETKEEIEYCHADMLSPEERAHPRGSGWARVYDKICRLLK